MFQKLNLIKMIAPLWGDDNYYSLKIYKSLIRSKIDFGALILKNANRNRLKII